MWLFRFLPSKDLGSFACTNRKHNSAVANHPKWLEVIREAGLEADFSVPLRAVLTRAVIERNPRACLAFGNYHLRARWKGQSVERALYCYVRALEYTPKVSGLWNTIKSLFCSSSINPDLARAQEEAALRVLELGFFAEKKLKATFNVCNHLPLSSSYNQIFHAITSFDAFPYDTKDSLIDQFKNIELYAKDREEKDYAALFWIALSDETCPEATKRLKEIVRSGSRCSKNALAFLALGAKNGKNTYFTADEAKKVLGDLKKDYVITVLLHKDMF